MGDPHDPYDPVAGMAIVSWRAQEERLPRHGRIVLASYDDHSIIVYQAFRSSIAEVAVARQRFGDEFSLARMSWVKPGFLWMMHRSGWAMKDNQERVLAVRVPRADFDRWLAAGVPSSFDPGEYATRDDWQSAMERSSIRTQWDPDHDPLGRPLARRSIQIGLRGSPLVEYSAQSILAIDDITRFVHDQHRHVLAHRLDDLMVPAESPYQPAT